MTEDELVVVDARTLQRADACIIVTVAVMTAFFIGCVVGALGMGAFCLSM